jgi:hypothetical protein
VFNGSDLGKGYSGQALMKRLEVKPALVMAGEKERYVFTSQGSELPELQFRDLSLPNWISDIAKEICNGMKAVKAGEEPINPKLNRTRKKKKGLSR